MITRAAAKLERLTRYFTGNECSKGHISERMVINGTCCECMKISKAKYKKANPVKVKESLAAWRANNVEHEKNYRVINKAKIAKASKLWKEENIARVASNNKQWRERNLERSNQNRKNWRLLNKDRDRFLAKRWRLNNPDKQRIIASRANAARRGVRGAVRLDAISFLTKSQKGDCIYCDSKLSDGFHIDHIMPIKLGGTHDIYNLQLLCPTCNLQKGARHPIEHAKKIGLLL